MLKLFHYLTNLVIFSWKITEFIQFNMLLGELGRQYLWSPCVLLCDISMNTISIISALLNFNVEKKTISNKSNILYYRDNGTTVTSSVVTKSSNHSSTSTSSSSNAFVVVDPVVDITDDETESQRQFVNVELSVAETQPIRCSGSGELSYFIIMVNKIPKAEICALQFSCRFPCLWGPPAQGSLTDDAREHRPSLSCTT